MKRSTHHEGPSFEWRHVNGVRLHVATSGPVDGPPVVLLHGFPEDWASWRHQIAPLARAGFRVLAPDQRGYGLSDKPPRVSDYRLDTLAHDILALADNLDGGPIHLVGHDWGGIVAWWAALRSPERIQRLAILNAPHPLAFRHFALGHPSQLLRSWYIGLFQLPRLPELCLGRRSGAPLARQLQATSRPGTFSDDDLAHYRRMWSRGATLRTMIHWYRALIRHSPHPPANPRISVPTLILWGTADRFLDSRLADASLALCDHARLQRFDSATHWLQHEEPASVCQSLVSFFQDVHSPKPG